MSKPPVRGQKKEKKKKKTIFVPTCHLCGVVGHIKPNCSLLRQKSKSKTRSIVRNTNVPKFVKFVTFVMFPVTFVLTVIN